MAPKCIVKGCHNRMKLHIFPKNPERFQQWALALKRLDLEMKKARNLNVCDIHFSEDQKCGTARNRTNLKRNAVPNLYLDIEEVIKDLFKYGTDDRIKMERELINEQIWIKTEPNGGYEDNDGDILTFVKIEPEEIGIEHYSTIVHNTNISDQIRKEDIEDCGSQQAECNVNCDVTQEPLQEEDAEYVVVYCIKEEPDIIEDPEVSAKQCFSNNSIENDSVPVCQYSVPIKEEIESESDHEMERENTGCNVNDVAKLENQCLSNDSIENDIIQVCHNAMLIKEELESDHEMERENTGCNVNDVMKLENQCLSNNSIENDIVQVCHNAMLIKEEIESDHEMERENTGCNVNDFVVVKLEDQTLLEENLTSTLQAITALGKDNYTKSKSGNAYKCDKCGENFSQSKGLKNHLLTHDKPHTCYQCGERFSRACNLKIHYEMHSTTKPFTCTDCDKSFPRFCELNIHLMKHNKMSKPFKCDYDKCYKRFARSVNLKTHLLKHTKPYICYHCGERFLEDCTLKTHYLTHRTTKPFTCKDCDKCFAHFSDLKVHRCTERLVLKLRLSN